jgi:hypothetical protein
MKETRQFYLTRNSFGDYEFWHDRPKAVYSVSFNQLRFEPDPAEQEAMDISAICPVRKFYPFEEVFPWLRLETGDIAQIEITGETTDGRETVTIQRVQELARENEESQQKRECESIERGQDVQK